MCKIQGFQYLTKMVLVLSKMVLVLSIDPILRVGIGIEGSGIGIGIDLRVMKNFNFSAFSSKNLLSVTENDIEKALPQKI